MSTLSLPRHAPAVNWLVYASIVYDTLVVDATHPKARQVSHENLPTANGKPVYFDGEQLDRRTDDIRHALLELAIDDGQKGGLTFTKPQWDRSCEVLKKLLFLNMGLNGLYLSWREAYGIPRFIIVETHPSPAA